MDFFGTKFGDTAQRMYNSILKRAEIYVKERSSLSNVIEDGPSKHAKAQVESLRENI